MVDTWPDPNDRTHLMHVNVEEDMKAIRLKAHGDPNSSNSAEQLNSPPVSLLELAEDAPENPHAALRGFFAAQILFILPRKRGHEGRDPER